VSPVRRGLHSIASHRIATTTQGRSYRPWTGRWRGWHKIFLKWSNSFQCSASHQANNKFTIMKKALIILFTAISALTIAVPQAKADHNRRIASYTSCGRPIYTVFQVVGYDRCGQPIGRWVTESSYCGCEVCHPRQHYDYGRPSYESYDSRGSSCDHDRYSHSDYRSSHRSGEFHFSFGR
jgi:hypothetical protein